MTQHFVFNGDADGLCALQQLRLGREEPALLVTGPKRDIELVKRVEAMPGDQVTVLDVSFHTNAAAVLALIENGIKVRYFDHHYAGEPPSHPGLELHLDSSPTICTSLIVNAYLGGKWRLWAAVGAFGDNFDDPARVLLERERLCEQDIATLRELGIALNYNAYGESEADLLIAPAALHERLMRFEDPLAFAQGDPLCKELSERLRGDLEEAGQMQPVASSQSAAVYVLPDTNWSRRVMGLWGNALANAHPGRAHAVLARKAGGNYVASVRAPKTRPQGAVAFCRKFATGGGRESAAGVNDLEGEKLDLFCREFLAHFGRA